VTAAKRPRSESIFHNKKGNRYLTVTIQDLIVQWWDGIAFSFHWVKGHAYLINRPLTQDEILNIEADLQSDVVLAQARGPIASMPNCVHWDIEGASPPIRRKKFTSHMKAQLTSQMHDGDIRLFLVMKETWSPMTFDSIDWHACELALI
jgi:hypothetical protein